MTPLRIAIIGERGAGKDAVATFFAQHYGCVPIAFAAPLKAAVFAALDAAGVERALKGKTRAALQAAGEGARTVDPAIWVRSLIGRYNLEDEHQSTGYVVTDVRYPNEAAAMRAVGFSLLRIAAPDELRKARCLSRGDGVWIEGDGDHISETAQREIVHDYLIDNSGTIDELYAKVASLATTITAPPDEYDHV